MDLFNIACSIVLDTTDFDSGVKDASSAADDLQDSLYDIGNATSDASSGLDNAADAADDTGDSLNDLAEDSDNSNNSFSGFSDIVDKFVTAGIAASAVKAIQEIGTALYDLALDADNSTATIAQGTGATGEDLEALSASAQTAFKNISLSSSTSLSDVSSTLAEINTRFGSTGEELEDLTVTIQDFATITGQDGTSAVDSLANVMSYWGLDMEDLPDLMDDITTASQGCQASASELESALANNAGAFQSLGYSTEDALSFLTMYSANGGDVSEATRIMRTAITNLSDATDDVPSAFQAAIDAIAECDTTAEALQAQVGDTGLTVEDVFGSTNAQKIAQNIQSGTSSIEDWTEALESNSGAMSQTVADSTTMSDSISSSMNRIKTDIQTLFSPGVEAIVTGAANALDGVVNFAESAPEKISNFATQANTFFTDTVPTSISGMVDTFSELPSKIETHLDTALSNVASWGTNAVNSAKESASSVLNNVISYMSQLPGRISSQLNSALSNIKSWGSNIISSMGNAASSAVSSVISYFSNLPGQVSSQLNSVISSVSSFASNLVSYASSAASNFASTLINGVSGLPDQFYSIGSNIITGIYNGIMSGWSWLTDTVSNLASSLLSSAKNALGIASPSKLFRYEVGEMIGAGLALGIEDSTSDVDDAMDDLLSATTATASGTTVPVSTSSYGNSIGSGSAYGSVSVVQNIYSQAQTAADLMREARYQQQRAMLTGVA